MAPPHMAILVTKGARLKVIGWNSVEIRRAPYPPSLSKSPARIMDPATGAST